jgi:hypothetical protein
MTHRAWFVLVSMATLANPATAQEAKPLVAADLTVSGVAVGDDSASVRRRLGPPVSVDSALLHYADLDIVLKHGKVAILSITGPSRATRRGLRVGDAASRAAHLYRPCYADSTLVQVCYSEDFDERAVIVALASGRVTRINFGRIIEP